MANGYLYRLTKKYVPLRLSIHFIPLYLYRGLGGLEARRSQLLQARGRGHSGQVTSQNRETENHSHSHLGIYHSSLQIAVIDLV